MTDNEIFYRFSPFIQDFIYNNGWQDLRAVQLAAARVIFETNKNLLITSSTASGKTEAAFFPIISLMSENMPNSVGALYIAPLKSLINDQFLRLDELLDLSGIPVFHWHGDVAQSHKAKLLKNPQGILQITPESLESLLMNRSNDLVRLFGDLRFIVIDEIHTLTGTDRGNQIICQLVRLARIIGHIPRRIGLSATIGDAQLAADWLGGGTGVETITPTINEGNTKWRIGMEHFFIQGEDFDQSHDFANGGESAAMFDSAETTDSAKAEAEDKDMPPVEQPLDQTSHGKVEIDPGYEYMYDCVRNKKAIVFSNSREETEYITATLRQIADNRNEPDNFLIHHGNLSASIREEAESRMKDDEQKCVVCATVTMELGIDIGRLERIVQNDAPNSVSSFLQRLGRSGRRGTPPEMMMVFREENPLPNAPLPQLIPWSFLRAIAIVQLYIEEKFIEPPMVKTMPFSLAFQQTLSTVASSGELTPKRLAERIMSLPPFKQITKEDYKTLLLGMLQNDFLEMTEEKGLIVGLKGERLVNSFKFYAVFKDSEDYTVRCESDEIGTITTPPPVGDRFALAGRVWEVEELDIARKLIYVKAVKGKMEVSWPGDYGEIHTKILQRMRKVLEEDTVYPYLKPNARHRLEVVRNLVRNTGMLNHSLVSLGGYTWCLFPWLGTRSFRTLRKFITHNSGRFKLTNLEFDGCYYMMFKMENGNDYTFIKGLCDIAEKEGIDKSKLVNINEMPVFEKYDDYIPAELLRRQYAADKLRTDEIMRRLPEMLAEYQS
ncbi:MAG: DEAD/DEAH box helicase [Clostridiales bacterium]|nr:DEAD/DEAH box helicase [Clostridiales bacterium]